MKRSKSKVLYGAIGLLGAAAAVFPLAIYHLVETAGMGGMHSMAMTCERACVAETFVGAAIAVIAIASLFIKNAKLGVASSAVLLAGGIAAIAAPSLIGLCESEEMACRYITAPTLAILGSAIIVLSAARLVNGVIAVRKTAEAV
ncbi:MAG: DUF4418 family protein [Oscillospiraceae bacterium]|jgi:hypothetical protein|nr:DUF4418 family protein [Oscillospiraceae bacterium]